ncbi:hypothetical protein [Streptococcus pluranimalium]|uniref:hypothetical protein n=1 Tax=Streptococcus pluranimalium TaxID=82348 RepID=UPI003F679C9A
MSEFSKLIKTSKGDEYYTPDYAVEVILPYIKKFKKIWCPFDKEHSEFVRLLKENGNEVVFGHIETGQDFFDQPLPEGVDCVVSNPPFSKRQAIFERLYELNVPFALIINMNGLFDAKTRWELFSRNKVELLIPKGRMSFFTNDGYGNNNPNFQSIYVCSNVLNNQLMFCDMEKR